MKLPWRRGPEPEPSTHDEEPAVRVLAPDELGAAELSAAARSELQKSFGQSDSDGGSSGRTVVIESDDRPDAITIDANDDELDTVDLGDDSGSIETGTASPGIDPRLRERRLAVKRSEGRRRLKWVLLGTSAVVIVVAVLIVLASPLLSIRQVQLDGAAYSLRFDGELVDDVVESLRGQPILTADLGAAAERLEESPWIRSARVTMHLPDRVRVEVREREPLAWYEADDDLFRVIDDDGRVIVALTGQPVDYVAITGVGPRVSPGEFAGASYRAAAQLVRALPAEVRPRVVSLGVTDDGELTMQLDTDTEVTFGLPDDLQTKLVSLVVVLRRQDAADLSVIDLTSGEPTIR